MGEETIGFYRRLEKGLEVYGQGRKLVKGKEKGKGEDEGQGEREGQGGKREGKGNDESIHGRGDAYRRDQAIGKGAS